MAKPFLFIVNPRSGDYSGRKLPELTGFIEEKMRDLGQVPQTVVTESGGHATEIAAAALKSDRWSAIVAAGGDGTINEVARTMLYSDTPLGILPLGSGNGLARHLHIPMSIAAALKRLVEGTPVRMDSARINGIPFFCTCGLGFDAAVSHRFASSSGRGLKNYVRYAFEIYKEYQPIPVNLDHENQQVFLLTFANAGQFGNNAWIAPHASINDGLLDLCLVPPFPEWYSMVFGARLFAKNLDQSQYMSYRKFSEITIGVDAPALAHFDGEPLTIDTSEIHIKCIPRSLTVIC